MGTGDRSERRETKRRSGNGCCCSTDAEGGKRHLRREGIDNMCPNPNPLGQRLLKDYNQTLQAWIPCFKKVTLGEG